MTFSVERVKAWGVPLWCGAQSDDAETFTARPGKILFRGSGSRWLREG